jgi:hypothetical protein
MATYMITVSHDGQTDDVLYLDSPGCQAVALAVMGAPGFTTAGTWEDPRGTLYEFGAWPGGCETDYDVWCAACGDFMWHGLECECPDRSVPREPVDVTGLDLLARDGAS